MRRVKEKWGCLFLLVVLLQVAFTMPSYADDRFRGFDWGESLASVRQRVAVDIRRTDQAHHLTIGYAPMPAGTDAYYYGDMLCKGYVLAFWENRLAAVVMATRLIRYTDKKEAGPQHIRIGRGLVSSYRKNPEQTTGGGGLTWINKEKMTRMVTVLLEDDDTSRYYSTQIATYSMKGRDAMPEADWEALQKVFEDHIGVDDRFVEFAEKVS